MRIAALNSLIKNCVRQCTHILIQPVSYYKISNIKDEITHQQLLFICCYDHITPMCDMLCQATGNDVFKPERRQALGAEGSSLRDVVVVEATKFGILNCYESIEGNSGEVRQYDRYYFNLRSKYQALAPLMEDGHLAGVGPSTSTTSAWPLVMPTLVVPPLGSPGVNNKPSHSIGIIKFGPLILIGGK